MRAHWVWSALVLVVGLFGAVVWGQDVIYRPGAVFVRRGTVSLEGSSYRVLIHLHPYMYDAEIRSMGEFIGNASSVLATTRDQIQALPGDSTVWRNTLEAFEAQISRATGAHKELRDKNELLKGLYPPPAPRIKGTKARGLSRPARQEALANIFGLASYGQVQELQNWAESVSTSNERIAHAVEEQYTFINKTVNRVNEQENRLNQLTQLSLDWSSRLGNLTKTTQSIMVLGKQIDAVLSLLSGSVTMIEYTSELRLLLDEELDRAQQLIRGRVPPSLLTPTEFQRVMEEARSVLPPGYSFTASPTDMALSLASAQITIITRGDLSPYYGILEFPIRREQFSLYQVYAGRVRGAEGSMIVGEYEIPRPFLAVAEQQYFTLERNELFHCLSKFSQTPDSNEQHLCTAITSVSSNVESQRPHDCSAAIYYESTFIADACHQSAVLSNATVFTHIQQNQWMYSSPDPAYMFRIFCPPNGEETHSSLPLHSQGGLLQLPEGCSGRYGSTLLPATFNIRAKFRVSSPVHRPFPRLLSQHWLPITSDLKDNSALLPKLRESLARSTQLKMPLRKFQYTLDKVNRDLRTSKFHKAYYSPKFASTFSVTMAILGALAVLGGAVWRCIRARRRRAPRDQARADSPMTGEDSGARPEMLPLQAVTGPAGSTPFPLPPGRRPLPALPVPVSIREVDDEGPEERGTRRSRRNRHRR